MANQRVTDLDPIVTLPDSGIIHVVDTTNNTQDAAGSSFKITKANLLKENTAAILLNTAKVGVTPAQSTAITNNTNKISFDSTSSTRLAGTQGTNTGDSVFVRSETSQLFVANDALKGQAIGTNGVILSGNPTQWWTGYIPLDPTQANIARTPFVGGYNGRLYFYDVNLTFISQTNSGLFTFPIPATARFLAFIIADTTALWVQADSLMVNYGTVAKVYELFSVDTKTINGVKLTANKITTEFGDVTLASYLNQKNIQKLNVPSILFKPTKAYSISNDTRPLAQEYSYSPDFTSSIYIDRLFNLTVGNEIEASVKDTGSDRFNFSSPKTIDATGTPIYNNGVDILTLSKTFTVIGNVTDVVVPISHISTKASYLKAKVVKHLRIGDSTGYGSSTALIDVPDGKPSKISDFALIFMERLRVDAGNSATDYIYKSLGTRNKRQLDFVYSGVSKTLFGFVEAQGGWAATDYYLYTDRLTIFINQGIFDRLGLGSGTGIDYTGSDTQKSLAFATPEGKFAPKNTAAFITHMNTFYGSITTYAQAVTKQNDLLANPNNPFFNSALTGDFRFSISKYLERYKTLADDGVTRLVVGSTAGTKVTNVNDYDVCTPSHITISLGTNDTNLPQYIAAISGMVAVIRAYDTNMITLLAMVDATGSYFPKRYPNYQIDSLYTNSAAHDKAFLFNFRLSVLENLANKVMYLPNYFTQPTAEGTPVKKTFRAKSLSGLSSESDSFYVQFGKDPTIHPNAAAYAEIGVQELSVIINSKQYMP
jgi:hypothetical protein